MADAAGPGRVARRVVLGAALLLAAVVAAGMVYEQWSRRRVARAFPPPGELVRVEGRRSHIHCTGRGSPTVILEAGLDNRGSRVWSAVQPTVAATTRVCSYDRAGVLWSEWRDGPRDANRIADELHSLLGAAAETSPYVMVGHSIGGPLVRVFARRFSDEVVGFVWIDSSHPHQLDRMPREVIDARPAPPSLLGARVMALTGLSRLRGTPPVDAVAAFAPTSLVGVAGERGALVDVLAQAGDTGPFGDLPLVVLTAGRRPRPPDRSEELHARFRDAWFALQDELAALSSNSDHRLVPDASHYIQLDDPGAVITAIRDVVTAVRQGTAVRRASPPSPAERR